MKKLVLFFLAVSVINVFSYFERDRFQFTKYSSYAELYNSCDAACFNKWRTFLNAYPANDLTEAKKILLPLRLDTATTLTKIKSVGHFIYSKFSSQSGYPSPIIHTSNPLQQYKILAADTAQKLFCGTYAQMFNYFCWSQNIVCRSIEIMNPGDHHVLNECYIPELSQWIFIDLTSGVLAAESDGRLLNVQDFLTAKEAGKPVQILNAENMVPEPLANFERQGTLAHYYKSQYPFFYYHTTKTATVYNMASKLKRYILPDYWYEIFSPVARPQWLFYIKIFFLVLWVILGSIIIYKRLHD